MLEPDTWIRNASSPQKPDLSVTVYHHLCGRFTRDSPVLKQCKGMCWWSVASDTGEIWNMISEVQFEKEIHEFEGILDAGILHSGLILWDRIFSLQSMCTLMYLIGHCSGFPSRIRLHGGAKVEPGSMSFHAGLKSVWRHAEGREMLAGRSNNSETPLPPTTFQCQIRGRLYPTFSLTSWNRQSNIHTHFTLWLGSCAKLRREPAFELLSECNTEWLPGETVLI